MYSLQRSAKISERDFLMSFDEKYSKAKEIIREARKKLLRYILLNPVRDADAMRHFYYDFAKLCERFEGKFNITEYGNVKFAYYGKPVPGKRFRYQFAYSGAEMTYTDTGHPAGPQSHDLPSVPILMWDMKTPEDVMAHVNPEILRRNVCLLSEDLLQDSEGNPVPADFEDSIYYYYFPDRVEPVPLGEIERDITEWEYPIDIVKYVGALFVKAYKVKGPAYLLAWTKIRNYPYLYFLTNGVLTVELYPGPLIAASSDVERTVERSIQGISCLITYFRETHRLAFMSKQVVVEPKTVEINGVIAHKSPIFFVTVDEYNVSGIKKVGYGATF